ncbi:MAG: heme-binding protein [Halobacteriales archaeon]
MDPRTPPPTEEGWYMLHDMRRIDWGAWRERSSAERDRLEAAIRDELARLEAVEDAEEGASGFFVGLGHGADLVGVHLRPALGHLDAIERRLDAGALGEVTERVDSYVSVTEVSGYLSRAYFEADAEVDPGLKRYIETRLHPDIPDAEVLSFYPMSKRRGEQHNWYDLPFEERAEHIAAHGEIGKGYAGRVTQVISGSVGFEDWEWGVTLFAEDPTAIKELLTEMRFDPSTSRYAEFGPFTVGRRMEPADVPALFAGEAIGLEAPAGEDRPGEDVRSTLEEAGVYAGTPHGEDVQAIVLFSAADRAELVEAVDRLVGNFDHYDTHEGTEVYEHEADLAVVSLWATASAAETAAGFLADLPGVEDRAGEGDGWETMGMFYTVKPEHRDDFVRTFGEVGETLDELDGHRETRLYTRVDDDCDMFIASRWDDRESAMAFFGDDAFRETVQWGRDVLERRPRHVFLA